MIARATVVLATLALFSPSYAEGTPAPDAASQASPLASPWPNRDAVRAWLQRETDVPPSSVVFMDQNGLIAISRILPPDAIASGSHRVRIRAELFDPGATQARSWAADLYANCARHSLRVSQALEFAQPNLQGPSRPIRPSPAWASPRPGTPFGALLDAVCESSYPRPLMMSPPPPPEAGTVQAASQETLPLRGEIGLKADPPAPTAILPRRPPPPAAGLADGPSIQVGAFATERQAQALLDGLRTRRRASLEGHVTAVVKASSAGKTLYRAMVQGFPSKAAAAATCAALRSTGETCLLR
jgi:hypothetical protein